MTNKLEPNYFYVYRLKSTIPDYIFISYQAFKDLAGYQNQINTASYDLILQGELDEKETPSDLYNRIHKKMQHNNKQLSLRASDVFVFKSHGAIQSFYLDPIGFTQIHNFFCG